MSETPRRPSALTITLTGAAPVRVAKADWPIVAGATEGDAIRLNVRQHADGRAIVYGVTPTWRGGEVVPAGENLVAAVERVGAEGQLPRALITRCLQSLPPRPLT